jgi:hypothetical protein
MNNVNVLMIGFNAAKSGQGSMPEAVRVWKMQILMCCFILPLLRETNIFVNYLYMLNLS